MDPIANMLTSIRNALAVKKEMVIIPYSKIKFNLAQILKNKDFVKEVNKHGRGTDKKIEIVLKYDNNGQSRISGLKRKSRSSQRLYLKKKQIKPIKQGLGISILSTPKGLITNQDALKAGVGGELICEIW